MTRHIERELVAQVVREGVVVLDLSVTGSAHYCLKLRAGNGVVRKFFTSGTPSEPRGRKNFISHVRGFIRQNAQAR